MLIPMAAAFVCVCLYCRRSCIVISFTRTVGSMRDLSAILIPRGFVMRAGKQLFFFFESMTSTFQVELLSSADRAREKFILLFWFCFGNFRRKMKPYRGGAQIKAVLLLRVYIYKKKSKGEE